MRTRIGTRMIVGAGFVTALSVGLMSVLILGEHEQQLVAERTREAARFSETIKSSTHYDMLENRREALHRQIETIGRQEAVERVRLFNKEGTIMFSSDAAEIGQIVDKQAEACYVCHAAGQPLERLPQQARTRVFRGPDNHRVLGTINPIENEPACSTASCHAHSSDQSVLGVLDVLVSLEREDRQIAEGRARMVGMALLTILAGSAILWWLNRSLVVRPVQALAAGTRAVAEGDLTQRIDAGGHHELGDLGRAFNTMTEKLADVRAQLNQADKLASVGRLAAGVAHEINNPLTGVLTYGSLLLKRTEDRPDVHEDLEVIVRETKRCRDIVKGLLDFSRQTPPNRRPTDINESVRRAVTIVMNQLRLEQVQLTLDLAPDLAPVSADANQIQQVVVNLLLNAVDAVGPAGGDVRVATRRRERPSVLEIEVSDSGCGIPPEDRAQVFEPFFSTKGTYGTGLGLAVSWGIVDSHGGTIDVTSDVGQGSRFTVRLPVVADVDIRTSAA